MDDTIYKIYDNRIGLSFQWKKDANLTQIIFRDTGFHLSIKEIEVFVDKVKQTRLNSAFNDCNMGNNCRSLLLQTPINKVSIAVSKKELDEIEDLFKGTLFQLNINYYINSICNN